MIGGATRLVGLIGDPVSGSLSPRMQNAAFAARGLDWAYVALPVRAAELETAVRGIAAAGFAGANVTIPHKQAVASLCNEAEGNSVNTLVFDGGRIVGFNTDREIVAGIEGSSVCVIGAGGAARALIPSLPGEVHVFSRKGDWPPDAAAADVIVNATPVTEELFVRPEARHAVVDLAYRADKRPTALVAAARAAGSRVIVDGPEALVRQGAAAFERWTGIRAPVEVMRRALGSK